MKYSTIALLLGLLLFSSCKKVYTVEREITIDAPQELVWEQVKFFKNWNNWSPWFDADSTMEFTYSGEDGNVESSYSWTSQESGSGNITNTGLTLGEEIIYQTQFIEPWESESEGFINLSETTDGKILVKWGFSGVNKGITSLFLNMDNLVGPDFEKGLELLKTYTEKLAAEQPKESVQNINFEGKTFVAVRELIDIASIQNFYATNFEKIMSDIIKMEGGFPSGIYYTWDMEEMQSDMAAAIPVAKGTIAPEGTSLIKLPAGKAILYNYYGDYKNIGTAHELMNTYIAANDLDYIGPAIEEYVTDPLEGSDPNEWLTRVIYLVK